METKADFIPVAFDALFMLTDGNGRNVVAVWSFSGNAPPTDDKVRAALKTILERPRNQDMRPMTYAEVELLSAKKETRQ